MTQNFQTSRFVTLSFVAALFLTTSSVMAQEPEGVDQLEDWQQEELVSLMAESRQTVSEPSSGPAPFELGGFASQLGPDGNAYMAYTLTIDPSKISTPTVAMYFSLLDPATIAALSTAETEDSDEAPELLPVFEDYDFVDVVSGGTEPIRISRAFIAPGGEYEAFIAIRGSNGGEEVEDDAVPSASMMLRQRVSVPDFWNGTLQTSTVIFPEVDESGALQLEQLQIPLTPEQQKLSPYTISNSIRIEPKFDRVFAKEDELFLIYVVYNPGSQDGAMPDLQIEYNFYHQTADGEEFFNKTQPQEFNAQTIGVGFNLSMGHTLPITQQVPLRNFPTGDFRLEIKLIDNAGSTELINDVLFTVEEA
tara:strand:- start:281 stop:1369 length:1089 start_codon:yes stop_codon:yes gene_type:complete